jgi:hypothetical protein
MGSAASAQSGAMLRTTLVLAVLLFPAACATAPAPIAVPDSTAAAANGDLSPPVRARLGETARVDGPKVTPLAVLEDSRCPMNARCVWAGRVRIRARIDLGSGSQFREMTQGEPIQVADGSLELVEIQPDKPMAGQAGLEDPDYNFGFRFMGGL